MKNKTTAKLQVPKPLNLIGGSWVPTVSGKEMDVVSPIDGKVFTRIADSEAADVDAAVKVARAAFLRRSLVGPDCGGAGPSDDPPVRADLGPC